MMTRMTGVLNRALDEEVRLQVGPIEYQVLVPEMVRRVIQSQTGNEISLHITEYLEGNSGGNRFVPRRIGFLTEAEVDFFDLFCTVEKIGAKKALKAMARPVAEIAEAITRQDAKWLSTLPGIGATTAEQIITTLKRKVMAYTSSRVAAGDELTQKKPARSPLDVSGSTSASGQQIDDVYQALMGLGHSPIEARAKLDALLGSGKAFSTVPDALAIIYGGNKG